MLFRGVIQQGLSAAIGDLPALGITSVLFGLAHSPVPGASSFTEACYGANFGLLYMVSRAEKRYKHRFLQVFRRPKGDCEVSPSEPMFLATKGSSELCCEGAQYG